MSNPTRIDRQFFRTIRSDLDEALAAVAKKHGVSIETGRAQYSYTNGNIKLEIAQITEDGEAVTPEREALDLLGARHGIAYGDTFTSKGRTYTVKGWKARARVRPVLCNRDDGKTFIFPADAVARLKGSN
jgi:hypothetical protein